MPLFTAVGAHDAVACIDASAPACRICGSATISAGFKRGAYERRDFFLRQCPVCRFSFVANPWLDFARIYSEAYYAGNGADGLVDYLFELEHPDETIRQHEWQGIVRVIGDLRPIEQCSRWLDFGCGSGGLVRHLRQHGVPEALGFEEGWIAGRARAEGIPIVTAEELSDMTASCDVVTAIEVLEHVPDPLAVLRQIRSLLKPGGLFFFTTGNAEAARNRLASWRYVIPEIHISFFEPGTAAQALQIAGLEPAYAGFLPGFTDIIRFKALKNMGVKRLAWWQRYLPWSLLTRLLDSRLRITAHPVGWATSAGVVSHRQAIAP